MKNSMFMVRREGRQEFPSAMKMTQIGFRMSTAVAGAPDTNDKLDAPATDTKKPPLETLSQEAVKRSDCI